MSVAEEVGKEPLDAAPQKYDWPDPPKLSQLAALDDAGLAKALGLDQQLAKAREALNEASALQGKAKEYAEERIERMFQPPSYAVNDLGYIVEDAKRAAKRDAKGELASAPEPGDVLD